MSRYFSLRNFGTLFGLVGGLALFGAGISPILANRVYDLAGSYDLVLWGIVAGFIVAACLFVLVGKPRSAI